MLYRKFQEKAPMNYIVVDAVVLAVLTAVAFLVIFRRLVVRDRQPQIDLEWCRQFSPAKYRPMERLFDESDYDFLATQPGFHPRITRRLRAERRKVFRCYLRCLSRDFERLSAAVRVLMLHAPLDRSDAASALMKQRFVFQYAIMMVRCRLVLQTFGIGTVDVRRLVASLEQMRDQLRQLSSNMQPAATI
jgi:hypothetical protein